MTDLLYAEKQVNALTFGEAAFSLLGGPNPQVVFLVRERSAVIKYLGETGVEVSPAMFPVGEVDVTAVIFRVGRHVKREYVTWWDFYRPGCADIFRTMVGQDFLSFHFYGDNARRDSILVSANTLGDFFRAAIDTILKRPAWNEDDFLAARLKICGRFPTPKAMWDAAHAGNENK